MPKWGSARHLQSSRCGFGPQSLFLSRTTGCGGAAVSRHRGARRESSGRARPRPGPISHSPSCRDGDSIRNAATTHATTCLTLQEKTIPPHPQNSISDRIVETALSFPRDRRRTKVIHIDLMARHHRRPYDCRVRHVRRIVRCPDLRFHAVSVGRLGP